MFTLNIFSIWKHHICLKCKTHRPERERYYARDEWRDEWRDDRRQHRVTVHTPTRFTRRDKLAWQPARQKCNSFESDRVAHVAGLRRRADMF